MIAEVGYVNAAGQGHFEDGLPRSPGNFPPINAEFYFLHEKLLDGRGCALRDLDGLRGDNEVVGGTKFTL